jgi:hypothetical protein
VLSVSHGPCWPAVIFDSSPSGEIVTVSDAAGGEEGEQDPLVIDWDGISRRIDIFEDGHRSTMNMAKRVESGWRTRTRIYSCCFDPIDFFNSILSTIQREASGRARMLTPQSLTCDLWVIVGNKGGIWGAGGSDMKIRESELKIRCKSKSMMLTTVYAGLRMC